MIFRRSNHWTQLAKRKSISGSFLKVVTIHLSLETDDQTGGQTLVSFKNRQFQGNLA